MENKSAEITFERSSGWIEHFSPDGMRYWTHAERNLQVSEEPDEIKDDGENIFNEEENISGEVDTNELNISIGADIVSPIMENVNEIHGEKNNSNDDQGARVRRRAAKVAEQEIQKAFDASIAQEISDRFEDEIIE